MNEFKNELIALLEKYNATIDVRQEEDDSFLYLQVESDEGIYLIDSGYRDLTISPGLLKREEWI